MSASAVPIVVERRVLAEPATVPWQALQIRHPGTWRDAAICTQGVTRVQALPQEVPISLQLELTWQRQRLGVCPTPLQHGCASSPTASTVETLILGELCS
jgi:hypothetical protein